MPAGNFAAGKRAGRTRYMLAPEGAARELDLSSSRCVIVRSAQTKNTDDANEEVFDVEDPRQPALPDLFRARRHYS